MAVIAIIFNFTSCKCSNNDYVEPVSETSELVVENLISMDREYVFLNYGENYKWFETSIVLNDFIDSDTTLFVAEVSNIFQVIEEFEESFDTHVVLISHSLDSNDVVVEHGFWVEDSPLNDKSIVLTFNDAMEKVFESNYPKPHSKYVVLRKEVGPNDANAQWIFGNRKYQLYVDAVTGEVLDKNPVFDIKVFSLKPNDWP